MTGSDIPDDRSVNPTVNTTRRTARAKDTIVRRKGQFEGHRGVGFAVAARRRLEIEGSHRRSRPTFTAVIPLLILGYVPIVFQPELQLGTVPSTSIHAARRRRGRRDVHDSRPVSRLREHRSDLLLITGSIAGTSTPRMPCFAVITRSWRRYAARCGDMTSFAPDVRHWAPRVVAFRDADAPMPLPSGPVCSRLSFGWRDLPPGALISALLAAALNIASTFVLASWFSWYGQAYGSFGVALALMSWVGIVALFWVAIAAVQGVYWESRADTAALGAIELASESRDIHASD